MRNFPFTPQLVPHEFRASMYSTSSFCSYSMPHPKAYTAWLALSNPLHELHTPPE